MLTLLLLRGRGDDTKFQWLPLLLISQGVMSRNVLVICREGSVKADMVTSGCEMGQVEQRSRLKTGSVYDNEWCTFFLRYSKDLFR
jgi:hypothetical protein